MCPSQLKSPASAIERLFERRAHGIKPGLETTLRLLEHLGHPQRTLRALHVAGTNGKGSVCAMLAAMLSRAGLKTGLYTSPHLVHFNERFQINGVPISDEDLAALIDRVVTADTESIAGTDARPATFFECATAMVFQYFHDQGVELAVIETGLGGRWDATNVVRPLLSVITRIDMDHTDFLGDRLEGIASEKAGIIKPGVPVITGAQQPEAMAVLERTAREQKAPLIRADQTVRMERLALEPGRQRVRIETDMAVYPSVWLPLAGRHQLDNAALAVAAMETLAAYTGWELSSEVLCEGLAACRWPGRFQVLQREPLVMLDVAHNPSGARALVSALDEVAGDRPWGLITGLLQDKDALGFFQAFAGKLARCWTVGIDDVRGRSASNVLEVAQRCGLPAESAELDAAWVAALDWAEREQGVVCVAGSLYLAGALLGKMEQVL